MNQPNYYAIIPANVRYSDIPANAKLLYGEITALSSKEGFCWASNQYFAELYGVSTRSITEWMSELSEKKFIKAEIENNYDRKIFIINQTPVEENFQGVRRKLPGGVRRKLPHINTSNNNTINDSNAGVANQEIVDLISTFKGNNPSYEQLFARKPQRAAAARLISKHGFEKIKKLTEYAVHVSGHKYAPTILDPYSLEKNAGKLIAYYQKENTKVGKGIIDVRNANIQS